MNLSGSEIDRPHSIECDVVVVGSGPAGASAAWELTRAGLEVVVVERGRWWSSGEFSHDALTAMSDLYDGMGANVTRGRAPMPYLQASAVGGTAIVNGAISWRLPRDVWDEWVAADPALADALPWEAVESACHEVEADLNISPTPRWLKGANDRLLARGAEALGLENRPTRRNTAGCLGSGRCLQGCPNGAKQTPDRTYLLWAATSGASVLSETEVESIDVDWGRAVGVSARAVTGSPVSVRARYGVVLAASAIGTPLLLIASSLGCGPVGRHFQAHPGAAVVGKFAEEVDVWRGSTQGHEVTGLRDQGLKFESLGFDLAVAATRMKHVGHELAAETAQLRHLAHWGCAVRAEAHGRVRRGILGDTVVEYALSDRDLARVRDGVVWLCRLMLAAGAEWVDPGVYGAPERATSMVELEEALLNANDPRLFSPVITHMFGTARMGSDPSKSVVGTDFEHHQIEGLWIADSSVFPTNTGVNPQTSIIAMAKLCAHAIICSRSSPSVFENTWQSAHAARSHHAPPGVAAARVASSD